MVRLASLTGTRYGERSNRGARCGGGGGESGLLSSSSTGRFTTEARLFSSSRCGIETACGGAAGPLGLASPPSLSAISKLELELNLNAPAPAPPSSSAALA
uniref:Uncharacterized protein n=1 Tax=Oryza brachyantha TaxID=4533 RepID=J3L686_ORYBR